MPEINEIFFIEIDGLGHSGEGVGHLDGYAVFVDGALPGERVEVRLIERKKRYGRAQLIKVHKASKERSEPPCSVFGKCGGCQLMHLSYEKQLEVKTRRVIDALTRIGQIADPPVAACIGSDLSLAYRNKIQIPVREGAHGAALGLYARASHHLVEVESCHIHCSLGEEVYQKAQDCIKKASIAAYDPITETGELRHLLIKTAMRSQEVLVILITNQTPSPALFSLARALMASHPAVKGVVHNLQSGRGNVILGSVYTVLEGQGTIQEKLFDMTFSISPASFFQINPGQAERLYSRAIEYADLGEGATVVDAYCGVGTLSLCFARSAKQVIGIECIQEAVEDARANALANHIHNAVFTCAHAEDFMRTLVDVDVVLLNPPRKGCERLVLSEVERLQPKTVIYISCDPTTLARDSAHLITGGYTLDAVQPYDMFPQTAHVECVAKFSLRT